MRLFLVPWACHRAAPQRPLRVVVLDKTVPFENRVEHRSLFWLLDHLKVVQADGSSYDSTTDYLGAYPGPNPGDPPARTADLTAGAALSADLLYLADTYGVYEGDYLDAEERLLKADAVVIRTARNT